MATYTVRDAAPANLGSAMFFQPGAARTSNSPTLARYTNPSGTIVELQTVGATFGAGGVPTGGTVLAITLFGADGTTELASFSDIAVPLVTFDTSWLGPVPHTVFALLLVGADTLTGGAANDTLTGFTGDDTLDGGGGVNTASFPGIRADHVIADLGGGIITVTGPAGTDTLSDIQYARFTDGLFALAPDVAPVYSIAPDVATVFESQSASTTATFTIRNTGGTTKFSTVDWAVQASLVGANANDFNGNVLPSGSVTFTPGETVRTITIPIKSDVVLEPDELFTVELSQTAGDALFFNTSAQGIILNDDVQFAIAPDKANRPEGTGDIAAVTPFTFTVTRVGYADSPQLVNYHTLGAATQGTVPASQDDFPDSNPPSGLVGFSAGEISKTITVNVRADKVGELNEAFAVILSPVAAATVPGKSSATGIILNDDTSFRITSDQKSVVEGNTVGGLFSFAVHRVGLLTASQKVSYIVLGNGPAPASASDFKGAVMASGTLNFPAGLKTQGATFQIQPDTVFEPQEGFRVLLTGPTDGATLVPTASLIDATIENDDVGLSIAATSANKREGTGGTTAFTFTLQRSGDTKTTHSVKYAVTGASGSGTLPATASDFAGNALPAGTVTFAPGETSRLLTINVNGDAFYELNERFAVTLSNPSGGATLVNSQAIGIITNDDTSLSIAATSAAKPEGALLATTSYTFTVTRSGTLTETSSATWNASGLARTGVAAASAGDFVGGVFPAGKVTFAPGQSKQTITVQVQGDKVVESNEGFAVTLSAPSAGISLATATATGTILDDDAIYVSGNGTFTGTAGTDVFIIGAGSPTITGGGGVDKFIFTPDALGAGYLPFLTDFNPLGNERIDVSRIDAFLPTTVNDAFAWQGNIAPIATNPGRLGFSNGLGSFFINGNVDNDTATELQIKVPGNVSLGASAFIL